MSKNKDLYAQRMSTAPSFGEVECPPSCHQGPVVVLVSKGSTWPNYSRCAARQTTTARYRPGTDLRDPTGNARSATRTAVLVGIGAAVAGAARPHRPQHPPVSASRFETPSGPDRR